MINFKNKNKPEYTNISILLVAILFIIIYSSLSTNNREFIAELLTEDISLYIAIVLITIITYFHITSGFVATMIFIISILPYFRNKFKVVEMLNNENNKIEGFKSKKKDDSVDLFNVVTGKGERVQKMLNKIDNFKKHEKREEVFNKLNNSISVQNVEKEEFSESEKVKLRKFNPNDEFDNNLLLTKEICDDIKKRISYEYETTEYLKKYISSRLQEIIDLLDLNST